MVFAFNVVEEVARAHHGYVSLGESLFVAREQKVGLYLLGAHVNQAVFEISPSPARRSVNVSAVDGADFQPLVAFFEGALHIIAAIGLMEYVEHVGERFRRDPQFDIAEFLHHQQFLGDVALGRLLCVEAYGARWCQAKRA